MGEQHVLVEKRNRLGSLTLNRPKALNALSPQIFAQLSVALEAWQSDPEIYGVVLEAATGPEKTGNRVFSAGGDLREVYERGRKDPELARAYLRDEYRYNWQLDQFTKPHVSLINGMVLGGGVGISLYGTHRVAAEHFSLAMPETAIGFFPDVGGSWFLGHLPYSMGLYLSLTGRPIKRADAYALGLVTHTIDEKHFGEIKRAMSAGDPIDIILDELQTDPGIGDLKPRTGWIEAIFSASSLDDIFERARGLGDESKGWSTRVLEELQTKSPTSLHLAHRLWKKGRSLNLRRALITEYRVVSNLLRQEEFYEGIRAMIIDKDKSPNWQPDSIQKVKKSELDDLFADNWGDLVLKDKD